MGVSSLWSARVSVCYISSFTLCAEVFNDDAEDDMMQTIRTGQIPDQLLQDILEEAGQFMYLFKHNPSTFLTNEMTKRKGPFKKKKRPEGIVSLTRPRFGKRSSEVVSNLQQGPDTSLENLSPGSPITRAIYLYLLQNYGIPIENKALRSQSETFSKLTRPRFGKRSHGVVHVFPEHESDNVDSKENLLFFEQEESED